MENSAENINDVFEDGAEHIEEVELVAESEPAGDQDQAPRGYMTK